jgi:hypothetical protein
MIVAPLFVGALLLSQAPAAAPVAPVPVAPAPVVAFPATGAPSKVLLPAKTMPRLFSIDLVDKGAGVEATGAVSQAVQAQAVQSHKGEVVTATQIRIGLDANAVQQMLGCEEVACMTDFGRMVDADLILGGSVAKVGDDFLITLLTTDPKTGARVRQVQRKTPVNRDLYFYAAKQMTSILLTGVAADPRVPVVVKVTGKNGDVGDALVIVDGKEVATGSFASVQLDPGAHEVQVKKGGYTTAKNLINVEEATPLELTVSLLQERVELWPVALGVGIVGAAMLGTGLVMIDYGYALHGGSSPLNFIWGKKEADSYLNKAPITETELCAKASEIWFFSGRAPQSGADLFPDDAFAGEADKQGIQADGLFAQDRCGVSGSPGVGGWLAIGSAVPLTAAAIFEVVDVISAATAE